MSDYPPQARHAVQMRVALEVFVSALIGDDKVRLDVGSADCKVGKRRHRRFYSKRFRSLFPLRNGDDHPSPRRYLNAKVVQGQSQDTAGETAVSRAEACSANNQGSFKAKRSDTWCIG